MKLASHNWMRPEPIEVTLARLEKCGYEAIEISGEPYQYDVQKVKKLLEKHNLRCAGSVTIMVGDRDLVREVEEIRKKSVQYCKDTIDMVKTLGGEFLCIVPATVGKVVSKADPDDEWKWAIECLREIHAFAKERDVRIGIEPINRFETNFIYNAKQALLLAQEVADDCGIILDGFHINIEEADPIASIREVGDKMIDFHVADTNRRPPGEGHHDWDAMIKAMNDSGYDKWLTNEAVIPFDRTPISKSTRDATAAAGASNDDLQFLIDHGTDVLSDEAYTKSIQSTADYLGKYIR